MEVQGRQMQAGFIEMHQFLAKEKVGYFSNRVIHTLLWDLIQKTFSLEIA